jgi:hypothetical protein
VDGLQCLTHALRLGRSCTVVEFRRLRCRIGSTARFHALCCLPASRTARNFTLNFLGTLARLPLGPDIIRLPGPYGARIHNYDSTFLGITFPTTVGLAHVGILTP